MAAQAKAERIEKLGSADAERIASRSSRSGKPRKMAIALTKLNEAGILMEFIKVLPEIAKEVNAPLAISIKWSALAATMGFNQWEKLA